MITESLLKNKIIVVLRNIEPANAMAVLGALYNGGIRFAEFAFDSTGNVPDAETAKIIEKAAKQFGGKMHIGGGTVLTKKQVKLIKAAGGEFAVSPNTNSKIIKYTKKLGLLSVPGAQTVSEIVEAHTSGADFIKLFPASALSPQYFKDVLTPLAGLKLLAVGGVTPLNIKEFINCGAVGAGISSGIVTPELVNGGEFETVKNNARQYVDLLGK